MTEIEKKAQEIAKAAYDAWDSPFQMRVDAAEAGFIEGVKLAAKVAERWDENSPYNSRAAAIRALIEETGETFTRPDNV